MATSKVGQVMIIMAFFGIIGVVVVFMAASQDKELHASQIRNETDKTGAQSCGVRERASAGSRGRGPYPGARRKRCHATRKNSANP